MVYFPLMAVVHLRRSNEVSDVMGRGGDQVLDKFLGSPDWYGGNLEKD